MRSYLTTTDGRTFTRVLAVNVRDAAEKATESRWGTPDATTVAYPGPANVAHVTMTDGQTVRVTV